MTTRSDLKVELALLALLALLWGSSYLFLKVAVAEIPPITLIAMRVAGATTFLLVVMHVRNERLPRDAGTWRMLYLQAIFNSIGSWTVLAWGQQYVDASLASVLNSTSPIFVFLFTALVTRHEPLGGRRLFGALVGFAGVVLIVGLDALHGPRDAGRRPTRLPAGRGALCLRRDLWQALQPYSCRRDRDRYDDLRDGNSRSACFCSGTSLGNASFGHCSRRDSRTVGAVHRCCPVALLPPRPHHRFDGCCQPELPARRRWRDSGGHAARRNHRAAGGDWYRGGDHRRRTDQLAGAQAGAGVLITSFSSPAWSSPSPETPSAPCGLRPSRSFAQASWCRACISSGRPRTFSTPSSASTRCSYA